MLDGYHLLTLTHRHTALENIGHAMADSTTAPERLQHLKTTFGWEELLYLTTCNRVMFLFYDAQPLAAGLPHLLLTTIRPDLSTEVLEKTAAAMQMLHGADAIRHLLEVAASMDSLVVGEREIIRQLREAYDRSRAWGLTGDHLRLLLRTTIETAKEVYSKTGIGAKALSIVALAFAEMRKTGLPTNARILLVGAGQTNQLFAKFLTKAGYRRVAVFNRTLAKAAALTAGFDGPALPLDALEHYSAGFDALIVCTGATQALVTPAIYRQLLAGETNQKVVVDLSIPNNVDKAVPATFPVQFIEIEDLKEVVRENLAFRERECEKAATIIERRILVYREVWHERQIERALAHIPAEVRAVKERAIYEVYGREFAALPPEQQQLMRKMLDYMEKKCVAIPIKAAKAIALHGRKQRPAGAALEAVGKGQ